MAWGWLVVYAVSTIASLFLGSTQTQTEAKPGTISDKDLPIADKSSSVPVVFGTCHINQANVVWWGNLWTRAIKQKVGKK